MKNTKKTIRDDPVMMAGTVGLIAALPIFAIAALRSPAQKTVYHTLPWKPAYTAMANGNCVQQLNVRVDAPPEIVEAARSVGGVLGAGCNVVGSALYLGGGLWRTNAHVAEAVLEHSGGPETSIVADGQVLPGKFVCYLEGNSNLDFALVQTDAIELPTFPRLEGVPPLDSQIFTAGYPHGRYEMRTGITFDPQERTQELSGSGLSPQDKLLFSSPDPSIPAIAPGNSGGVAFSLVKNQVAVVGTTSAGEEAVNEGVALGENSFRSFLKLMQEQKVCD